MNVRKAFGIVCVIAAVIASGTADARPRNARPGRLKALAGPVQAAAAPRSATVTTTTPATTTPIAPVAAGLVGTGLRRVSEVLRDAAANRSPGTAAAIDPELAQFADDANAWVDSTNKVLFIDEFGDSGEAPSLAGPEIGAGVDFPPGNTFGLNSRPGSSKTIFLDFDGYTVSGTAWNASTGVTSRTVSAFDYDNIAGTSATDETYMRAIWQAVADDYAAFDVNVTTQQPSDAALYRSSLADNTYGAVAVITQDKWMAPYPNHCGSGCGGVAYVGIVGDVSDDRYYGPAWAFPSTSTPWTYTADTISHEVGHNLGLSHDGLVAGAPGCTVNQSYFGGNGIGVSSWAPIMGSPNGKQYSQWSKGEYSCANQFQDDVAIIGSTIGFTGDESTSFGNAVPLPTDETPTVDQVVGSATDVDYFAIAVTTGFLRITVKRTVNYASLQPRFVISNSSGTELGSGSPFMTATSGGLTLSGLPSGTYHVSVMGLPYLTPQTGFSNYANFGYYNVAAETITTPFAPGSPFLSATGSQSFTASWSPAGSLSPGAPITYSAALCDSATGVCGTRVDTSATSVVLPAPTKTGSFYVGVNARHVAGRVSSDSTSSSSPALTAPIVASPVRLVFDDAADSVRVVWGNEQEFAPVLVTSRTLTVINRSTGLTVFSQNVSASGATTFTTSLSDVWLDATITGTTAYGSQWNPSPVPAASVFLGRIAAPQTPGGTTIPRTGSPQAPGGSGGTGRPAAPQA
jgi:hypothetical protein